MFEAEERYVDYSNEPLVWDAAFRTDLLSKIAKVGVVDSDSLKKCQRPKPEWLIGFLCFSVILCLVLYH